MMFSGGNCVCLPVQVLLYLSGRVGDDVLNIPPGETGPHLQHQRDHARRQRSRRRGARVGVRAPRALLQRPVGRHLDDTERNL